MDQIHELGRALAKELGDGWEWTEKVNRDGEGLHQWATLTKESAGLTRAIFLRTVRNRPGRLFVAATAADEEQRRSSSRFDARPEITVAASKTPEEIAKDIRRRLFPPAEAWWGSLFETIERRRAYEDGCARNVERFRQAFPELEIRQSNGDSEPRLLFQGGSGVRAQIRVDHEGGTLELSANGDEIETVLRALHAALEGEEARA